VDKHKTFYFRNNSYFVYHTTFYRKGQDLFGLFPLFPVVRGERAGILSPDGDPNDFETFGGEGMKEKLGLAALSLVLLTALAGCSGNSAQAPAVTPTATPVAVSPAVTDGSLLQGAEDAVEDAAEGVGNAARSAGNAVRNGVDRAEDAMY
jgi:hypothetical protein